MSEKNLWDAMTEFLKEYNIDLSFQKYFDAWPLICPVSLSSCTRLSSIRDLDNKKIYVTPSSLSSKSLLKMEEKNIIRKWNERFPDKKINKIVILNAKP